MTLSTQSSDKKVTRKRARRADKRVLVVDVGGTNVKVLCTGQTEPRKFPSGKTMTPERMIAGVKKIAEDWTYDAVAVGYPGRVLHGQVISEPYNLAKGWVGFDFEAAFGRPTRIVNDAAMQALGSYSGTGTLLFLGFGTGLGSALVVEGKLVPMELGHLSYRKKTFEDYVGKRGLKQLGRKKWQRHVTYIISRLIEVIRPDDVILGGGEARMLKKLPPGCRLGNNANAFAGGFLLCDGADDGATKDRRQSD